MSTNFFRFFISIIISSIGVILTYSFFDPNESLLSSYKNEKPIARLIHTKNEVLRKTNEQMIWGGVTEGQDIYAFDSIKTSSDSEAKIEILSSKTYIEMDPDSSIIMDYKVGDITVNFISGNLFIKGGGKNDSSSKVSLKRGDTEIDLKNAKSLVTGLNKNELSFQLLEGQANVLSSGEELLLNEGQTIKSNGENPKVVKNGFKIITPLANETLYIQPEKLEPISFQFQNLKGIEKLSLWVGTSRSQLREISVPFKQNSFKHFLKLGTHYWKIIDKTTHYESQVFKLNIESLKSPVLLEPENQQKISFKNDEKIDLRWANPSEFEEIIIEVSNESQFKNSIIKNLLKNKNSLAISKLEPGQYFWRASGLFSKNKKLITSDIHSFYINQNKLKLDPPLLVSPQNEFETSLDDMNTKGVQFIWNEVSGAQKYRIEIIPLSNRKPASLDNTKKLSFVTDEPNYFIKLNPAGKYKWAVKAIDENNKVSGFSQSRNLNVIQIKSIKWVNDEKSNFVYKTNRPSLELNWFNGPPNTDQYQIKVVDTTSSIETVTPVYTSQLFYKFEVPSHGEYYAEIKALDKNKVVVAKTSQKLFVVEDPPEPNVPRFTNIPQNGFVASQDGSLSIQWTSIERASEYELVIEDTKGEVISKHLNSSTKTKIKMLLPGEYFLVVRAKDGTGRFSQPSRKEVLSVPQISNIAPPSLKNIKIQ